MTLEKVGSAMSWNLVAKAARFVAMPLGYAVIVRSLGEYDWGLLNLLRTITGTLVGVGAGLFAYPILDEGFAQTRRDFTSCASRFTNHKAHPTQ